MSVPKKRQTLSAKKRRASHFALKPKLGATCDKCAKPVKPHHVCSFCGFYKGKEVVKVRVSKEEREMIKKSEAKKKVEKKAVEKK